MPSAVLFRLLFNLFFSLFRFLSESPCLIFNLTCQLLLFLFCVQVIYLNKSPEEAFRLLASGNSPPFLPFRYAFLINDIHVDRKLIGFILHQRCFVRLGRIQHFHFGLSARHREGHQV